MGSPWSLCVKRPCSLASRQPGLSLSREWAAFVIETLARGRVGKPTVACAAVKSLSGCQTWLPARRAGRGPNQLKAVVPLGPQVYCPRAEAKSA
jgi:hypothetical protein